MPQQTHYDVLGLSPNASQADIHRAWDLVSMKFQPDQFLDLDIPVATQRLITDVYVDALHAHRVLKNPATRKAYDESLRVEAEGGDESNDAGVGGTDTANKDHFTTKDVLIDSDGDSAQAIDAFDGCRLGSHTNVAEPEKHIFETMYRGLRERTLHTEIICEWQKNLFHYSDGDWKINISLDPSYARVRFFLARNNMHLKEDYNVVEFRMAELEFLRPPKESDAKKPAVRVQIEQGPWDRLRLHQIETQLLQPKDEGFQIMVQIRTKSGAFRYGQVNQVVDRSMDVSERVSFTTNVWQRMAAKAKVSHKVDRKTLK